MPYLSSDSFFTLGTVSFVRPKSFPSIPARIVWKIPDGWDVASPWVTEGMVTEVPTVAEMVDNYMAVGNFQKATKDLDGFEFEIAWFGKGTIPKDAVEKFAKVFEAAKRVISRRRFTV